MSESIETPTKFITPSAEEEALFLQMEKDLDAYGKEFARGTKKPIPQYDDDLFLRFRLWQADRLEEACRELDEDD